TTLPPLRVSRQTAARILPATSNFVQNVHMRNSTQCVQTVLFGLCLLLAACDQQIPPWDAGKLVVVVPETALGPEGELERELARLLAEQLHVTLETVPLPQDEVLTALRKH